MPRDPLRIILTPVGSSGDVHPYVGVGRALKQRGHDVTVVTSEPFKDVVERAGLTFHALGTAEEFNELLRNPDLWHPRKGLPSILRMIATRMRDAYDTIDSLIDDVDSTVLVGHSIAFAARMLEDKRSVNAVTIHLAPSALRSLEKMAIHLPGVDFSILPMPLKRLLWWFVDRVFIDRHIEPELNRWRRELDLPPVRRPFRSWVNSPRRVIGLFPQWFGPPQPDWPPQTRLTGFPLWDESGQHETNHALESFLGAGRAGGSSDAPIAFTPGSANMHGPMFFRAAIDATALMGRRALLLTRYPEQLPDPLPDHVMHVAYAPFSQVFPRCAAVVHHGGIGTCGQGLRAGVPQVVMPLGFDQPDNAMRLKRLGVGTWVTPRRFKPRRVAQTLSALIESDEVRDACVRAKRRVDPEAALQLTSDLIEQAAAPRRG